MKYIFIFLKLSGPARTRVTWVWGLTRVLEMKPKPGLGRAIAF